MKKEYLENIVKNSVNYSEVCKKLHNNVNCGNRKTIIRNIKKYNIDISHFTFMPRTRKEPKSKVPTEKILVKNSTYNNNNNLKKRLYKEGLKKEKCELCGQGNMWMGKKISLIMDHINGNNTDNRIENLRIVCPNCNATLPTHCGKNIKVKERKKTKKEKENTWVVTSISQRKTKRPPYETLVEEIRIMGYTGTGKKYGVSDNAIRKWIKFYKKYEK